MVDQRKKERQEAPGGGSDPENTGKTHEIKEPAEPRPADDPKRKKIADAATS